MTYTKYSVKIFSNKLPNLKRKGHYTMKKITLIVLVLVLVTSCITFTACDPYNDEIKSVYDKIEYALIGKLNDGQEHKLGNVKVNNIVFGEEVDEDGKISVDVYYSGDFGSNEPRSVWSTYKLAAKYYNALVEADKSVDALKYLEALDACIQNMEFVSEKVSFYSNYLELDENQAQQFNETFFSEYGEDQIGFLPYFIERVENNRIEEGNYNCEYKFIVKGFNFVKNSNGTFKLPSNTVATILTLDTGKSNVDVYEQEIEIYFKLDSSKYFLDSERLFSVLIRILLDGEDVSVNFNTTSTNKVDLTEKFIKMTMGQFDFKQPANAQ